MSKKHTITINGTVYDAITGLPVNARSVHVAAQKLTDEQQEPRQALVAPRAPTIHAPALHQVSQKSTTLRREHLKKPANTVPTHRPHRPTGRVKRSPLITHFAAHPQTLDARHVVDRSDNLPTNHKLASVKSPSLPADVIKQGLLNNARNTVTVTTHKNNTPHATKRSLFATIRMRHIVTACVALIVLAGYVTYLNMPGISVRFAASQAGVRAGYPSYQPDGYSLEGPIAFDQGVVELRYKANGGGEGYTIRQQISGLNSVAVFDTIVSRESEGVYQATTQSGVTVYTYDNKAVWSNGGVLYTIDSHAPLSNDQLLRIASSL